MKISNSKLPNFIPMVLLIILACFTITTARKMLPETRDKINIVVEGMVYCQGCDIKDLLKPVPNATVKLRCINFSEYVNFEELLKTDDKGYFFVKIEGFKIGHPIWGDPRYARYVKLVSSPLRRCYSPHVNISTLRYENKVYRKDYEAMMYAAHPMTFRPAAGCPGS